jgi:proteasome lid subunit RPN8/RPN11
VHLLDRIGNTPLLRLERIVADFPNVEFYAKAEWFNPGGSVKDRPAYSMIREGERSGALEPGKTILDATSGNTGIAYAMIGAALGYRVKLCLPSSASPERKQILQAYGVEIVFTPGDEGTDGAIRRVHGIYESDREGYFYPDQYSNPANPAAHYRTTAPEISADLRFKTRGRRPPRAHRRRPATREAARSGRRDSCWRQFGRRALGLHGDCPKIAAGGARGYRDRVPGLRRKIPHRAILERSVSDFVLKISEELAGKIRAHGVETYPHECCGAILGRESEGAREVLGLMPLANRREDSPRNRFEVTPDDVRLAENSARDQKLELIGWYHSHPDAPARPSEFDREHAWPWYSYIIVSVQSGQPRDMNSWRLRDDRSAYGSEAIESAARSASI